MLDHIAVVNLGTTPLIEAGEKFDNKKVGLKRITRLIELGHVKKLPAKRARNGK